jgi:phospholipid/cholesterol/gamma-HCH transport system substrate-binding protein
MRRNQKKRIGNFQAGVLTLVLLCIGIYLGFTKSIPFRHHYTVSAVFRTANNVKPGSFVRIAGVNVGKVTSVDRIGGDDGDKQAAVVKMRIEKKGLPIHKDATLAIRPRIFLEGNFFVDLKPGSPAAPTIGDGDTIPINQTSAPVQLDQILTSLQGSTRQQLQRLLDELSTGLDKSGGGGFNRSIRWWPSAYKNSAIVADAQLGEQPHDLSNYLHSSGQVAAALNRNPTQLKELITKFNITAAAFARQQDNLSAAIHELPRTLEAGLPALKSLNDSFPHVRAFVADFRPATRSSGPALDASTPLLQQLRGLVSKPELQGLVRDLRPTVPSLVNLNQASVPLYEQVRLASSCQTNTVLPWSNDTIQDPVFPAVGPVYVESTKPFGGLAGESRSGDANGQWFRVLLTGGNYTYPDGAGKFLQSTAPLMGVNPPPPAHHPQFQENVPCETQDPPDLRSTPGNLPQAHQVQVTDTAGYQKVKDAAAAMLAKSLKTTSPTASDAAPVKALIDSLRK